MGGDVGASNSLQTVHGGGYGIFMNTFRERVSSFEHFLNHDFKIYLDMSYYISEAVYEEIVTTSLEERFRNIEHLSEEQKECLYALINRRDVFAILPTGHEKSLIFQFLPDQMQPDLTKRFCCSIQSIKRDCFVL